MRFAGGHHLAALLLAAACSSAPVVPARDVAPKGALRVAIGVGPAASPFWATRDSATAEVRGVTVALGKAAAARLGVPLKLVLYQNSGEITAAAAQDAWDISFMPQDAEREKFVDVGPAYVVYESSYLVRAPGPGRCLDPSAGARERWNPAYRHDGGRYCQYCWHT